MLFGIAIFLYVLVCILLVLLIIIQSDKGGGISGAIGGGLSGANQFLGTQDTANILTRGTTVLAGVYMVLCILLSLGLSRLATNTGGESALRERAEQQQSFSPSSALEPGLPMQEEGQQEQGAAPAPELAPQEAPPDAAEEQQPAEQE
jgi:preprotein translocase subunit SecG